MVVIHEDHLGCPTRSVTCSPGSVGTVHCSVRPEPDHTSTCSLVFARTVVTATVSLFGGPLKPYDVAYLCGPRRSHIGGLDRCLLIGFISFFDGVESSCFFACQEVIHCDDGKGVRGGGVGKGLWFLEGGEHVAVDRMVGTVDILLGVLLNLVAAGEGALGVRMLAQSEVLLAMNWWSALVMSGCLVLSCERWEMGGFFMVCGPFVSSHPS